MVANSIDNQVKNYLAELEKAEGSYEFQVLLENFKQKALDDETSVWFLFKAIIKESIESPEVFETKPSYIVGVFYILNDMDNEKSYSLLKWFIQNCSETTPMGVIELLSTLITSFSILEFKEFYSFASSENQAQSALGFLTLYNLLFEDRLTSEQIKKVVDLSKTYKNERYPIEHAAELIREHFRGGEKKDSVKIDLNLI
ncbi:MAG: hypothetical protein SFU98_03305 [Leptospiraceae bacterium]|nr:hypothetical protein [Leptospiraceae bacterium]